MKIVKMDEFTDIPGYDGYKINRSGYCIGRRGYILKPLFNGRYYYYHMPSDGIGHKPMIHRLVALTFIPNPEGLETVDHINENKADNRVENLRWMTRGDNAKRASKTTNAKCYQSNTTGFQVHYKYEGIRHSKRFKNEDDAQFYVSLLKAIYPHY